MLYDFIVMGMYDNECDRIIGYDFEDACENAMYDPSELILIKMEIHED